jgi:hypothetical protein
MDNRPDENGLINNHIPKSEFFKTDLDLIMGLDLLTGYFAHPYKNVIIKKKTRECNFNGI